MQIELMTTLKGVRLTHEVLCEEGRCFVWVAQRIKKTIVYHVCAVLCSSLLSARLMVSLQGFQTWCYPIQEGRGGKTNKRTLLPWRPYVFLCKRQESSAYFTPQWTWEENLVGFTNTERWLSTLECLVLFILWYSWQGLLREKDI